MNEARRKQTNCRKENFVRFARFVSFRWKSGNAIFCKVRQKMQPTAADSKCFPLLSLPQSPSISLHPSYSSPLSLSLTVCESIPLLVIKLHLNFFYLSFSSIPVDCPSDAAVCCVFSFLSLTLSLSLTILLLAFASCCIVSLLVCDSFTIQSVFPEALRQA